MHSSLVLLTVCSIILIILMITCFICFIRSRRREDEELMERVQYNSAGGHHQQLQFASPDPHHQSMAMAANQRQMIHQSTPQRHKHQQQLSQSPSANMLIITESNINPTNTSSPNNNDTQFYDPTNQHGAVNPMMAAGRAGYNVPGSSPYHHSMGPVLAQSPGQRQDTRSDITQQINSAIIGSSEAEFQNDFIQVFPMYQIAPQPEKNTTPYLT